MGKLLQSRTPHAPVTFPWKIDMSKIRSWCSMNGNSNNMKLACQNLTNVLCSTMTWTLPNQNSFLVGIINIRRLRFLPCPLPSIQDPWPVVLEPSNIWDQWSCLNILKHWWSLYPWPPCCILNILAQLPSCRESGLQHCHTNNCCSGYHCNSFVKIQNNNLFPIQSAKPKSFIN